MAANGTKRAWAVFLRSGRRQIIAVLLGALISMSSHHAQAQETSGGTPPAPAAQPLDIVLLKNGGMLRGTIAELVPGQYVVITLTNGEQRRIDMGEVKYAGPAKDTPVAEAAAEPEKPAQPRESAPRPAAESDQAEIQLTATSEGVRFHVRTGEVVGEAVGTTWGGSGGLYTANVSADAYRELCTAPCTANLPRGSYTFGLSEGDGKPVRAPTAIDVNGQMRLSGTYDSYLGMRIAGIGLVIASAIGGLAMVLSSSNDCDGTDPNCEPIDTTLLYGGLAVTTVGGLVGILLALKKDEAEVEVARPTDVAPQRALVSHTPARARPAASGGGLSVPVFATRF